MAKGPGKYDDVCTMARQKTGGEVLLLVIGGNKGTGFALQTTMATKVMLPDVLEQLAAQIRQDPAS